MFESIWNRRDLIYALRYQYQRTLQAETSNNNMTDHTSPPPPVDGIIPPSLQPQIHAVNSLFQLLNDFQFEYVVEAERIRRRGLQHNQFTAATKALNSNNNNIDTVLNNSINIQTKKPAPQPTPAVPLKMNVSSLLPVAAPTRLAPPPSHLPVLDLSLQPVNTKVVALNNASVAASNTTATATINIDDSSDEDEATAAAAITGKFELNWEENMLALEAFKKNASYLSLYRWALFQKRQWKKYLKGEPCSPMIQLHMGRLMKVGLGTRSGPVNFPRASPKPSQSSTTTTTTTWNIRFLELVKFKQEYGHTDLSVHTHKETHLQLARWVGQQRQAYFNLQQKKKTGDVRYVTKGVMKEEQVQKLMSIGFRFNPLQLNFDERLEQIKYYKARFGNTRVPVAYADQNNLGYFVDRIRKKFRNGQMSAHQIEQLEAIEFDFSSRRRGPLKDGITTTSIKDKQPKANSSSSGKEDK